MPFSEATISESRPFCPTLQSCIIVARWIQALIQKT